MTHEERIAEAEKLASFDDDDYLAVTCYSNHLRNTRALARPSRKRKPRSDKGVRRTTKPISEHEQPVTPAKRPVKTNSAGDAIA